MRTEIKALFTGVVALSSAVLLAGCPGKLREPERFLDGGAGDGGTNCPDVPKEIFAKKCAGNSCHGGSTPALGLDLVAPDVATRVVGKDSMGCTGRPLADPSAPETSVLYIKVAPGDMCGSRMPLGNSLSDEEVDCVKSWIGQQTAAPTTSAATGATGAGGAGGGGAGGNGGAGGK
jgi:hypothetical protein